MCHWKKWIWPGILTALVLSALALWMKTDIIQDDLTAKAESALVAGGHTWANVDMEGRDAVIFGDAPSEAAQLEAAQLTDGAYEVRVVDNQTELLVAQSPYILNAKRDGDAVELTGFIPNEGMRGTIVAAAKEAFPGAKVTESMTLARGAPAGLAAMAGFGFSQLSGLTKGEMGLSDTKLTVKGAAKDRDTYTAVNSALDGTLPGGATLAMKAITAPTVSPYTWSADYDGNKVILGGYVPSMDVAKSVVASAKSALPDAEIVDNQLVAPGNPDGFDGATTYALQQLPRFSNGKVGLSNLDLSVSGVAKSSGKYTAALGAIGAAALPAGITLAKANIVPATVSPYIWGSSYNGNDVTLTGFVPDAKARASVLSATKKSLPTAKITDEMQIAAGAPEGFVNAARFGSNQLTRFSSGLVSLSDRALAVKGVAKTAKDYTAAKTAITSGLPGDMTLASENIVPPTVKPYTWGAKYDGKAVVLSGFVPNNETRAAIVARTKKELPGAAITDQMLIAAGAPAGFQGSAEKGVSLMPGLATGDARITDTHLIVNGTARTVNSYDTTVAAKGNIKGKIKPAMMDPYSWSIVKGTDTAVISGFVPDRALGTQNQAVAKAVLSKPVEDKQRIASGAPAGFKNAIGSLIAGVNRLDNSSGNITGTNAFIQGRASSKAEAKLIGDEVGASLPKNFKYRKQISYPLPKPVPAPEPPAPEVNLMKVFVPAPVPEAPAPKVALMKKFVPAPAPVKVCLVDFPALFYGEKVHFDTARAVIKEESFPLLKRIAAGLNECKDSTIEVGGHTDSRGSEGYNQGLSEARAQAVIDYMSAKAGVTGTRMVAKGYGELKPIAPNTRKERSKNRRIEFKSLSRY
ncbi:MAG: OmpA family protein [Rhizobiaceae bacterium]